MNHIVVYCFCIVACFQLIHGEKSASAIGSKLQEELGTSYTNILSINADRLQDAFEQVHKLFKFGEKGDDYMSSYVVPETTKHQLKFHKKEELQQERALYECPAPGYLMYSLVKTNVCSGRHCMLRELLCGNQTVTLPGGTGNGWNQTLYDNCYATKIDCITVHPEYEAINLKERFKAVNCIIDPTPLVIENTYYAQLVCANNMNYGYKSYGLPCTTDAFKCGTKIYSNTSDISKHADEIKKGKCSLTKTYCESSTTSLNITYSCKTSTNCTYSVARRVVNCTGLINSTVCECPADLTGPQCTIPNGIVCDLALKYPPINCLPTPLNDPKDSLLDGDRKCTVFDDYNAFISLGYELSCTNKPIATKHNFTYWIASPTFNLTYPPQWLVRNKIFNFNLLSEIGYGGLAGNFTKDQVLGNDLIWFNFSLNSIPDRFWFARRLYYELAIFMPPLFRDVLPAPEDYSPIFRGFLDAPTRPISTKRYSTINMTTVILIVVLVGGFIALCGYVGFKVYKKMKVDPKKTK